MPFQPAPNIATVEVRMVQDGQRIENTLNFRLAGVHDAQSLEALADAVRVAWVAECMPLMHGSVQLNSVYAKSLNSAIAPAYESFPANAQFGGVAGDPMPNNVSWCIKFTTGLSGRSGRGRNFIAGIARTQVVGNLLQAVVANAWVDAYVGVHAAAQANDWQPVVLSRKQGGVTLANAVGYAITGVGYVDRVLDSQRRRLPQRGT